MLVLLQGAGNADKAAWERVTIGVFLNDFAIHDSLNDAVVADTAFIQTKCPMSGQEYRFIVATLPDILSVHTLIISSKNEFVHISKLHTKFGARHFFGGNL
jgi:hypothetical protein